MTNLFKPDPGYQEGVPRIKIYLLKILFTFMFVFLSFEAWSTILNHSGPWNNGNAAAYCMWGAYAIISFIGILRPLKMLPIVLFEIIYKITWLLIVSYPLWKSNTLSGSPAEGMTYLFLGVIFPVFAMPWKYFFRIYVLGKSPNDKQV